MPPYQLRITGHESSVTQQQSRSTSHSSLAIVRANRHDGWSGRPVAPGVVAAAKDSDFARFHADFLRVEHEHDLAFQDDTELQRARLLHVGMRRLWRVC